MLRWLTIALILGFDLYAVTVVVRVWIEAGRSFTPAATIALFWLLLACLNVLSKPRIEWT